MQTPHAEVHKSHRAAWLRAAVLGVNDGVVSTASIMLGVAGSGAGNTTIITAGIAGLSAGALSMAVGEYVSVSSQRDSQRADIIIEKRSLADNPKEELAELTHIYTERGLSADLARKVAEQLHAHDALASHVRDELGFDSEDLSRPGQAALASALAFSLGAVVPIIATLLFKHSLAIVISSLVALAISGAIGAIIGGGHRVRAALRVLIGGALAMAITAGIGRLVGHGL